METFNTRQMEILEILRVQHHITIRQLADRFDVSTMTVRRDLDQLEHAGLLIRTFGGGVSTTKSVLQQPPAPLPPTSSAKQAIGRVAAALVSPGQTVLVDAGSTTLEVVTHLPRDAGITVVTNSLHAAHQLLGSGLAVLLLGGYLSHTDARVFGPLTENNLSNLHADILFVGCEGANSQHGFYMSDLHLTSNVQAMVRTVNQVVVVAESSKFQRRSLSSYAAVQDVHVVVTDDALAESDRANLTVRGVRVLLANPLA